MVFDKSFSQYEDGFSAFDSHVIFQKQQELLYRVDQFRFKDWKDLQMDSDVIMGRLLHNRIGYTTKKNIPMLLGLKPEPWIGPMEEQFWKKFHLGLNVTRQEIMQDFPREMNIKSLQRDLKRALDNLERQMLVVKQFEDVGRTKKKVIALPQGSRCIQTNEF